MPSNDELRDQATEYLDSQGIRWSPRFNSCMIIVYHPTDTYQRYDFRYTTGRWASLVKGKGKTMKHYRSKGIEDFVERFVLK
jgi:hypothetical protein